MDNTTLQQQYQQTLENTIGMSQRKRNEYMRSQGAGQNSNVPSQWSSRGAEGFRGAGFQETPDQSSLSNIYNPSYVEGGQEKFGTYSSNSKYYQPMLDMQKGMRDYDVAKEQYNQQQNQYKQKQQDQQNTIDDLYSMITASTADWQDRWSAGLASLQKYVPMGFIPGKNNGDWIWTSGMPWEQGILANNQAVDEQGRRTWDYGYVPEMSDNDKFLAQYQDDGWAKIFQNANRDPNGYKVVQDPNGSKYALFNDGKRVDDWDNNFAKYTGGYWLNSNGSPRGVTYNPLGGFYESDFDHKASGFAKAFQTATMATLGAMFGGAGGALAGGTGLGASVASGVGAALPNAVATGANTGDWGKALTGLASGALAGGMSNSLSPYIKGGLSEMFGDTLSGQTINSLTKAGTGAATGVASKGLSNILSNNKFGQNIGMSAMSGALAGLGGLFTPKGGKVADYENLANTLGKVGTAIYKNRKG